MAVIGGGRAKSLFLTVDEVGGIEGVLMQYRENLKDELRESLLKYKVKEGNLAADIKVDIQKQGNILSFQLSMPDYWKFVDRGVKGWADEKGGDSPFSFKNNKKRIPTKGLMIWIAQRGEIFSLRTKARTLNPKLKGKSLTAKVKDDNKLLAYKLSWSIKRKGLRPRPFFRDVVTKQWKDEFKADIRRAVGYDIVLTFKDVVEDFKRDAKAPWQ